MVSTWLLKSKVIKDQTEVTDGACEYALYVQGMILRNEALIQESLESFQAAAMINPNKLETLKQVKKFTLCPVI